MKKIKNLLGFLMLSVVLFASNSCSEENPTYENTRFIGCSTPGNLEILAKETASSLYFGGCEVFLYLTAADRDNDPQRTNSYRKAATDQTDPTKNGAVFYELPYQEYFFFCKYTNSGLTYTGANSSFVPACTTTKLTCDLVKN